MGDNLLTIAYASMPPRIASTPAYGLGSYAIELPAHVVVAVKAIRRLSGLDLVSIPQEAINDAERLRYEIVLYVHAKQSYYLTNVSKIKQAYVGINQGAERPMWVVPFKVFTEYTQAKADKMQGVLLL